ncbi:replication restart helicase PriA [Lutimonas saemankumensis]|uniref:replication restart helicase PriA n=1 Tax=Lutimonas saemankumensis TaxID=483016 RepID=UPI0021D4564F|nr:primosomal protein N' [Lutimonas saemankumensis]
MPIPLQKLFTYKITEAEADFIEIGTRVAVPFGKSKIYTAIVFEKHQEEPTAYEAKDIYQILDEFPLVTQSQLQQWEWIASYYMCSLGDVLRASLPKAFLLESETLVLKRVDFDQEETLNDEEYMIWEALEQEARLKIHDISKILDKKGVLSVINGLLAKDAIEVKEEIFEQYKPKYVKYVDLTSRYQLEEELHQLLDGLGRAPKQREIMLNFFQLKQGTKEPVLLKELKEKSQASSGVIKSLVDKGIFEIIEVREDRVSFQTESRPIHELNDWQSDALGKIREVFKEKEVCLLHGVTSSGKTEIYTHLIADALKKGKQVLYLLPEIALTTHIISRLQLFFGESISVFHSRYSVDERVEVWNNLLNNSEKAQIVLGARSSVLLPFSNLGLIIVDEEHESSFKQFEPAPRYHARDTAILLGKIHGANVVLGSATPSIETFYNAQQGKYGYVRLDRRYGDVLLPEIELVDIKEKHRKKRMKGHFSDRLLALMEEALSEKEQIILFQNRRGYSPVVECSTCGVAPQCPNCDVSLTYHKFNNELKCHYCGYQQGLPRTCPACENPTLDTKGFGTEQIELELQELFPDSNIARMDLDTTRGKYSYQKLLRSFHERDIDILVGTQMLTKGLDFKNVTLVGVLNADNLLNFPDFRAHERTYQLMVQVSGRAGRDQKRGKVAIQSFNPYHQILQQVTTHDYKGMYEDQMNERHQFSYPPLVRLIRITLKHKDLIKVDAAANWMGKSLSNSFGDQILGPTSPSIGRIRNKYLKTILIKLPANKSLNAPKQLISTIKDSFMAISEFRSVQVIIDVDCY